MLLGDGLSGDLVHTVDELVAMGLKEPSDTPLWTSEAWWRFVAADPDHEVVFLVISDGTGPVAVAPAIVARGPENLLFYNPPRILGDFSAIGAERLLTADERAAVDAAAPAVSALREALYPSLAVGVFGSNLGLRAFDGHHSVDRARLVPALARLGGEAAARRGCRSHALLYLDPDEDAALRDPSAQRLVFGGEGILDLPPGGLDGYLGSLPSRRRIAVRREIRQYADLGVHTTVHYGPDALTDEHVPLRAALRARYGHAAGQRWVETEFATLRRTLGDRLVVFSARRGERIIGYLMAARCGDVLYTRAAGFDYAASAGAFCYFNLVYYDVVRWAERAGVRRVHYGLGTSAAKHHRGCALLPRWAYLWLPGGESADAVRTTLTAQHATAARLLTGLGVTLPA
ncbi:hypothetical protein GCM10009558_082400 [Virgisporangium aurantiacum]